MERQDLEYARIAGQNNASGLAFIDDLHLCHDSDIEYHDYFCFARIISDLLLMSTD